MNKFIIGFFAFTCMVSINMSAAHAQKDKSNDIPATHMWLRAGDNMVFVPTKSLKQCEIYTRQAAALNSSETNCYHQETLIKAIKCIKPTQKNKSPRCS